MQFPFLALPFYCSSEILLGIQPPRTPGVLVPVTQTDSTDPQQTRRALCHQWHVTGPRFLVSSWSGFRFLRPFVRFLRGGSISAAQTLTSSAKVARRSQRGASDARVERKRGGSWAYVWPGRQLNQIKLSMSEWSPAAPAAKAASSFRRACASRRRRAICRVSDRLNSRVHRQDAMCGVPEIGFRKQRSN